VAYANNQGYVQFKNSVIYENKSLFSSILMVLSAPTPYSLLKDTQIYNNQQVTLSDILSIVEVEVEKTREVYDEDSGTYVEETYYETEEQYVVDISNEALSHFPARFSQYILENAQNVQEQLNVGLVYSMSLINANLQFDNATFTNQSSVLSSYEGSILGSLLRI